MKRILTHARRERGQILILAALLITIFLGLVGLAIDAGFHYVERRQLQNAADQATLAAAYELSYGGNTAAAATAALENAAANGFNNDGSTNTVVVNIPPASGDYTGETNGVEVVITDLAVDTFFIQVLVPSTTQIVGRGVAVFAGTAGQPGVPTQPVPIIVPDGSCSGTPVVDGRAQEGAEGYAKVAGLISTTTSASYGDAFYACDDTYFYFALRMNGPSTGGNVANENVYGGCKDPEIKYKSGEIDKVKGTISSIGANTFMVEVLGQFVTVDVDGSTNYKSPLNDFADLTVGMSVEVRADSEIGPLHILAKEVKKKKDVYCNASISSTYHSDYNTGWADSAHTFGKLEGSDRARFQISCDGAPVHDFIQDYLRQVGTDWVSDAAGDGEILVAGPNQSASSLEFNLENPLITGWGDDPGEDPLVESPPFSPQYPSYDSEYDGFIWEMIYEFRVPKSAYTGCNNIQFGLHDFPGTSGGLEGMHSSPAKTADGVYLQVQPFTIRLVE